MTDEANTMTGEAPRAGSTAPRSLSATYREGLRRSDAPSGGNATGRDRGEDPALVDAEDLCGLAQASTAGVAADVDVLSRLARTPDAVALLAIATSTREWSQAASGDIHRVRNGSLGMQRRRRGFGWVSLAAAASLAVVAISLHQPAPMPGTGFVAGAPAPAPVTPVPDDDVLFSDPDSALVAAISHPADDAIFVDSLGG